MSWYVLEHAALKFYTGLGNNRNICLHFIAIFCSVLDLPPKGFLALFGSANVSALCTWFIEGIRLMSCDFFHNLMIHPYLKKTYTTTSTIMSDSWKPINFYHIDTQDNDLHLHYYRPRLLSFFWDQLDLQNLFLLQYHHNSWTSLPSFVMFTW